MGSAGFWLVVNFWISFPHPATGFGWIALSLYLALFFPLYIYLVRSFLQKRSLISLIFIPPLAWCAVEWLRKHLLGGFSFASLEHAFYQEPLWIQSADLFGEYTVGMFVVLTGSLLAFFLKGIIQKREKRKNGILRILPVFLILIVIGSNLYYGKYRMDQIARSVDSKRPLLKIALLQDNTLFSFPVPEKTNLAIHEHYRSLNRAALQSGNSPDLIVWPESCFVNPGFVFPPNFKGMNQTLSEKSEDLQEKIKQEDREKIHDLVPPHGSLLLGRGTVEFLSPQKMIFYNSAFFISKEKEAVRYDKIHRVMFGEYIPFADSLPDSFPLKTLCNSVQAGKKSVLYSLSREQDPVPVRILPNICFESSVPHLIQKQVRQWSDQGETPDLILNISNDGWFRNSWQIDLHLATHVFRALENRKITLSATHGGLSAVILPDGSIVAKGNRGEHQIVDADLMLYKSDQRSPLFPEFPGITIFLVAGALLFKYRKRRVQKKETKES